MHCFSGFLPLLYLILQFQNLYSDLPEKEVKHGFEALGKIHPDVINPSGIMSRKNLAQAF